MKAFDSAIASELQKEVLQTFFLLSVATTAMPMRFTDADIPIYHNDDWYYSRGLKIGQISSGSTVAAEKVEIELDDADQSISAILLNEDARNKSASLYFGVAVRTRLVGGAVGGVTAGTGFRIVTADGGAGAVTAGDAKSEIQISLHCQEIWRGFLSGWEMSGDSACRITLTHEFVLWNKSPLRRQSSSCQWPFKGVECAYSGVETWCDKSHDRCSALGNAMQFGGFRFLPAVMEKEIWWGRTPK